MNVDIRLYSGKLLCRVLNDAATGASGGESSLRRGAQVLNPAYPATYQGLPAPGQN